MWNFYLKVTIFAESLTNEKKFMSGKFEVSFNSPQCGWMSIGFKDGTNEFQTTTAHAPHSNALSELLGILVSMVKQDEFSKTLKWNRDPEEFDFVFRRKGEDSSIEIFEYPTEMREEEKREKVYYFEGEAKQISAALLETFGQLYEERDIDEFEDNWHQKFPFEEYSHLKTVLGS